jgi:hypothetical protein
MKCGMTGKSFSRFTRCPFHFQKFPWKPVPPPQSFDASYAPDTAGCNVIKGEGPVNN